MRENSSLCLKLIASPLLLLIFGSPDPGSVGAKSAKMDARSSLPRVFVSASRSSSYCAAAISLECILLFPSLALPPFLAPRGENFNSIQLDYSKSSIQIRDVETFLQLGRASGWACAGWAGESTSFLPWCPPRPPPPPPPTPIAATFFCRLSTGSGAAVAVALSRPRLSLPRKF